MSVTPFDAGEALDEVALRRHLRFLASGGVTICLGSYGTGEGHLLRPAEISRLYAIAVDEVGGRAPLCAGALGFGATVVVIEQALAAAQLGVDQIQIHPPRPGPVGIRPRAEEIERYYRDVLETVRQSVVLTNQVFMVGYSLPPELIAELLSAYPQIASLIHTDRDASSLIPVLRAVAGRVPVKVGVIGHLLDALAAGANGAACFEANLAPRLCASIPERFAAGEHAAARASFERCMRLGAVLAKFQNPRSVKAALQVVGLDVGPPRRPYLPLPTDDSTEIAGVIEALGLVQTEHFELRDKVTSTERRARYERAGHWDGSTLAARVHALARADAQAVAVVDRGGARRHTRGELARDAGRVAAGLARAGVAAGDVVSVQLPNVYEAAVAAVAIQQLGAVQNPLLPNYRRRELEHVFRAAAPRAIFTPASYRGFDHRQLIADVRRATGVAPWHVVVDGDGGDARWDEVCAGEPAEPCPPDARRVSELIFTSGTEARPKAIMHSEQTANFSVRVAFADMQLGPVDVVWMPSPVGHSTGFNYGLRFALYHGLKLVLQDTWSAAEAVKLVAQEGCSYTLAATTFLQDLIDEVRRSGADLRSLRCFGCGGAPVPSELVRAAARCGIGVRRLYGSTEVLVATWNRADTEERQTAETDGRALSQVEIEIRSDEGALCPPGTPGEIFVRGPNTCVGFYADPERTSQAFLEGGWVRSGDLGVLDAAGYLAIVGRKKEIIIRGGINIAPREIEDLLLAFPEVERAAVIGLPDPRLGERCCACLVLRPGQSLDFETLVSRLRATGLATYKLPERLALLDSLPTTASGKVQKHRIAAQLTGTGA